MANVLGNIGGGAELLEHGIRYVQVSAPEPDKVEELQADLKAKGLQVYRTDRVVSRRGYRCH